MKSVTLLFRSILPFLLVLVSTQASWAQYPLPVCSGNGAGKIYYADDNTGEIYIMNPSVPLSGVTPLNPIPTGIFLPAGSKALAIGTNYGTGPNPTYYTTGVIGTLKYLQYWNGLTWVTTSAVMNMDAITGSCGAIIGLDCTSGFVWKWAGGTATTTSNIASVGNTGTCDIAGDCTGGFWVINQSATVPTLRKFSNATPAVLLQTFTFTGTYALGGEGLAVNGNLVYYDGVDGELYRGVINTATSTVNFSRVTTSAPFTTTPTSDFASCGYEGLCLNKGALDSVVACADTARVNLTATGPGPYNFTVVSGPATIIGTGPTVTVVAAGPSVITYLDADCNGVNTVTDTTVVFVTYAKISAGLDDTIIGCRGYFLDTLVGTKSDTTAGVVYAYSWEPLNSGWFVSGNTTLDSAIISPKRDTTFWLEVTTLNGCKWVDSVKIYVADSTPKADFTWISNLGCEEDTVRFINLTPTNVYVNFIEWDFYDTVGNNQNWIKSNAISPTHIYKDQAIYPVLLTVSNQYCLDTIRKFVNILHPIIADFRVDDDSVCTHKLITFTDQSTTYTPPGGASPTFFYTFGDGDSSHLASPTHTYTLAGNYTVRLVVVDALGCSDTVYKTIVVDTIPFVRFVSPDSIICEGEAVTLIADYLRIGNTGLTVDMGDGSIFQDSDTTIYSFAQASTTPYTVKLTAHYRICPDTTINLNVLVTQFPGVNIGPDTVLCPNGSPIVLADRVNIGNPAAKWLWNTGDTTASILAKDIGTYWTTVTIDGCADTDSLFVNKDCFVDIPNSFTPNGDGINDFFLPRQFLSRSLTSFKMSIFNRWGQVIYESSSINGRGWDGRFNDKDQPQGVYVYMIDVSFDNGVQEHYTGNVTLLR